MNKVLIMLALAVMAGSANAADFFDLQHLKASDVEATAVINAVSAPNISSDNTCSLFKATNIIEKQIGEYVANLKAQGPFDLVITPTELEINGVNTLLVLGRYDYISESGHKTKTVCYAKFNPKTCKVTESLVCIGSYILNK